MATGLISIIKQAAMDAVENGKPCDLRFGTVSSVSPLKVRISSDFILPESLLVVPEHLTDYSMDTNIGSAKDESKLSISVVGTTLKITTVTEEVEGDESTTESIDERTLTMYNGLNVGDNVVLLRNQGGSKYLILDRV